MAAEHEISTLPVAVRVFPNGGITSAPRRFWQMPEGVLIIQTKQMGRGWIGFHRFLVDGNCVEEIIFHDRLSTVEIQALQEYVSGHFSATDPGGSRRIRLLTRDEYLEVFYDLAYKGRCLVVGFNLVVDLARLSFSCAAARRFFAGGFSFVLWTYIKERGGRREDKLRPRLCVKYLDRTRSLIAFTGCKSPDPEDLIPEGSPSGEPKPGYRFPGHFLDLRTLSFALADEVSSLEEACEAFGVTYGKKSRQP